MAAVKRPGQEEKLKQRSNIHKLPLDIKQFIVVSYVKGGRVLMQEKPNKPITIPSLNGCAMCYIQPLGDLPFYALMAHQKTPEERAAAVAAAASEKLQQQQRDYKQPTPDVDIDNKFASDILSELLNESVVVTGPVAFIWNYSIDTINNNNNINNKTLRGCLGLRHR
jgi:hypothetical protein